VDVTATRPATPPKCFRLREVDGITLMLDVELLNGDRRAFPYSYLMEVEYRKADGVLLKFASCAVLVKGRNLDAIYQGLVTQRVEYLREESPRHDLGPESDPFVSGIVVADPPQAE